MTGSGVTPPITSLRNPLVVDAARIGRDRVGREGTRTLLEGPVLVAEAVAAGAKLDLVFATEGDTASARLAEAAGCRCIVVDAAVLAKVSTTRHPQSPVAVMVVPTDRLTPGHRALVAWGIGDPGNCGALIRTAAGFGYDYIAGPGTAQTWSPKVIRAAAGGHFRTGVGRGVDLSDIGRNRTLVATVPRGGRAPGPLPANAAILIGSEPHGLPADVVSTCPIVVTIPMSVGSESLNAAVAGAIVAFFGVSGPSNLANP